MSGKNRERAKSIIAESYGELDSNYLYPALEQAIERALNGVERDTETRVHEQYRRRFLVKSDVFELKCLACGYPDDNHYDACPFSAARRGAL